MRGWIIRKFEFYILSKLLLSILALFIHFSGVSQIKTYKETFTGSSALLNQKPWILHGAKYKADKTVQGTIMGTGNATVVNDPTKSGNKVLKVDKKPPPNGENYDVNTSREEILYLSKSKDIPGAPDAFPPWFTPITYRWRFYFTGNHDWDAKKNGNFVIGQWHHSTQSGISGGPPANLRIEGNSLELRAKWASPKNPQNKHVKDAGYVLWKNLKKNTWYYIVMDITWDYREGKTGQIKAYMKEGSWPSKSNLVMDHSGKGKATGYNFKVTNYAQVGLYTWRWRNPKGAAQSVAAGVKKFEMLIDDWEYTQGKHSFSGSSNESPTANAGPDQSITLPKSKIILNGTASDPDGTVTKYNWRQISGPSNAGLKNENTPNLEANNLKEGVYLFRFTSTDNKGASDNDDVLVTVKPATNQDPVANAGPNKTITLPKNKVTFTGSGSDPDGTIDEYLWTQISGPSNATQNGENTASFEASNLQVGKYVFRLSVTDNNGASDTDNVSVTVKDAPNQDPNVNAGPNKTIVLPKNTITLKGSASDSDGSIVSYQWTMQSGPNNANLTNEDTPDLTAKNLVEGTYVFRITVTDDDGAKDSDGVSVIVKPAVNTAPVADAGPNKSMMLPKNSITLNGSGSDADGTIEGYSWSKISGPSKGTMSGNNSANLDLSNLTEGKYVLRLTVTDNLGAEDDDDVVVTVNARINKSPTANSGSNKNITLPNDKITLKGTGADPDGTIDSFSWKQKSGPSNATLSGINSPDLTAENLVEGTYIFTLTVTDNDGATDQDGVQVIVHPDASNKLPSANAGQNKTITLPTDQIVLSGNGSDSDGTIDTFGWTQVSGPSTATLSGDDTQKLTASNLIAGRYVFKLTVTDNSGDSSSDNVTVTVRAAVNQVPVARAGSNKSINLPNNSITITGSGSDADGTITSFEWTQTSGPSSADLVNADQDKVTARNLQQGRYVLKLTVTDNDGASADDEMHVVVHAATVTNQSPTANAGSNKTITLPKSVITLTGSGTDPDGTINSYQWSQISGGNVTLVGINTSNLEIRDFLEGIYEFQLTVTDNLGEVDTDQVRVTVLAPPPSISADVVDASCEASNGAISINLTDGKGPFTYLWSNGAKSRNLQNITTGDYQIKVTDANGNSTSKTFTVGSVQANLQIEANVKNATCADQNGSIQVQASGGTGPYSFEWSSKARTASLNQLTAGNYSVTVKDQNGCSKKISFEVGIDPGEVTHDVTSKVRNASCAGDDGSISLTVNGSQSPYSFVWEHGATGPEISSLIDGKYEVTISDKHGCFMKTEYTVNQDPGPAKPIIGQSADSLYVTQQAHIYQWYKDSVIIAGANQRVLKYSEAGTYSVQISNDKNCTASSDYFYAKDPPRSVAASNFTMQQVEIYPNPVVRDINVLLKLNEPAATTITIYDFQGRVMLTRDLGVVNSQVIENVNVELFPSGTYLIRAASNNELVTRRFIKY